MKWLIILVFSSVLVGCVSIYKSDIEFPKEQNSYVEFLNETFISIPLEMEIKGDNIYISDFRGDSLLWCYNLQLKTFKRLLPYGEGPEEFLSPIQFFINDSVMNVYNRWHYSLRCCVIDSLGLNISSISKTIKVSTDVDMIYPLGKTYWIASGRFTDSRFLIMNEEGEIVSNCGSYPNYMDGEDLISNFPKFMFHQTMFGFREKDSCLVCVTNHVLDFWNYNNKELLLKKRILLSPYTYQYKEEDYWASAIPDNIVEKGTERVYCTDDFIYLLYNPNIHKNINEKEDILNSEIWVFDWNGNPITKICTNKKIICFCVDPSESMIYCIFKDADYEIGKLKYVL